MGLIDLHVHAGPSVMPRELDGVDMYKEAVAAGYSAYVIKDHYFPTMMSAENISRHMDDGKCKVYGGLALNNSVGGLNLKAVDAACALGAKIIWMPTVSALRHKIMHSGHGLAFPGSKGMSVEEKTIMYLDDNGELQQEVKDILAYLSNKPDVILATGHGSRDEIDKLIREAVNTYGLRRILVNHPHSMIGASMDDIEAWAGRLLHRAERRGLCGGFPLQVQRHFRGEGDDPPLRPAADRHRFRLRSEEQRQSRGRCGALHRDAQERVRPDGRRHQAYWRNKSRPSSGAGDLMCKRKQRYENAV